MNYIDGQKQQFEDLKIKKGLMVSLGVHIAILIFFTVKTLFFAPDSIDFQAAVRVDLVGLPDKVQTLPTEEPTQDSAKPDPNTTPEPNKSVEKPAEKKSEPAKPLPTKKEPEAVNINKQKSKEKAALDKLKAMAAMDKIKDELAKEKKESASGKAKTGAAKIKGNVISPGTSLTGLSKLQHDTYIGDLDTHIKKNWSLPEWLAKKDYKAQVRVKIDDRGNIISRQIVKSSGNSSYDSEVLSTVDRSAPFPAPPEKFSALVEVDGILIGFPE